MYYVNPRRVNDASAAPMTSYNLTNGVIVYTEAIKVDKNVGFLCLSVLEDKSGAGGDVDIYAEYSDNGTDWFRPYISDLAGTITQEGNIVTTLGNTTTARRIYHTARMAKFVRYAFDPDADSRVTVDVAFQESDMC